MMKYSLRPIIFFLICYLLLASCKKEATVLSDNYIKYAEVQYNLFQGYWENFGNTSREQRYKVEITLLSSGIILYDSSGKLDSLSGKGQVIKFNLLNSNPAQLDIGDYFLYKDSSIKGTLNYVAAWFNADRHSTTEEMTDIAEGKVTIKTDGKETEITFECKDITGKTIYGYFKGILKYFNND